MSSFFWTQLSDNEELVCWRSQRTVHVKILRLAGNYEKFPHHLWSLAVAPVRDFPDKNWLDQHCHAHGFAKDGEGLLRLDAWEAHVEAQAECSISETRKGILLPFATSPAVFIISPVLQRGDFYRCVPHFHPGLARPAPDEPNCGRRRPPHAEARG